MPQPMQFGFERRQRQTKLCRRLLVSRYIQRAREETAEHGEAFRIVDGFELLPEVLCLGFVITPRPYELLERGPITSEEFLECLSPCRFTAQGSLGQQAPVCRGEIHVPGRLDQRRSTNGFALD